MKVKILVICSLILGFMTGCMSEAEIQQKIMENKQALRENPGSVCRFTINKDYQEAYRITRKKMIEAGMNPKHINAELHTDTKQASITTLVVHIEIKALSPDTSEVTEYYFYKWKYKHSHESHCADLKKSFEE